MIDITIRGTHQEIVEEHVFKVGGFYPHIMCMQLNVLSHLRDKMS